MNDGVLTAGQYRCNEVVGDVNMRKQARKQTATENYARIAQALGVTRRSEGAERDAYFFVLGSTGAQRCRGKG